MTIINERETILSNSYEIFGFNWYITEGFQSEKYDVFDYMQLGKRAQIDLIGVKDIGTQYSNEIEIVTVEVKDQKRAKISQ